MPDEKLINDIVQSLRAGSKVKPEGYQPVGGNVTTLLTPNPEDAARFKRGKVESGAIQDTKFDVPKSAIYDRLSDGSYVAKFENYKGATGNEDRLAREQTWGEQMGNGLLKNAAKTGTYFLDATVGTVAGIINWIDKGEMSAVWDNDFSNKLDDANKQLDYNLPNYYTDEQKSLGLLGSTGTANFWFNDVANGLAFVGGALLPELIIGGVTGGSSLGVGAGKLGMKLGMKAGKETAEFSLKQLAKDVIPATKGRDIIRGWNSAIYGKAGGDIVSTAGFLARTSNFEAGMEARSNFKEAMTEFYQSFEEENGRAPTLDEISAFSNDARRTANYVYGANLAILSVSNAAMFGKAFNLKLPTAGKTINNFANRAIGLGTKTLDDGTQVLRGANKFQKVLGTTYKILEKPVIEGIYEEGLQGVTGRTMQKYLEEQYDPNNTEGYSLWAGLSDAFAEQYGTKEGWKEMGIGMIIGFAGGAIQPGQKNADGTKKGFASRFPGLGKNSRKSRQAEIQNDLTNANNGLVSLQGLNHASSVRNYRNLVESGKATPESISADNAKINIGYIKSQEHIKSSSQIRDDYHAVITQTELDKEQINQLAESGISVEDYKTSLTQEFDQHLKDYNFAKKAVAAVGLDRVLKNTPGNTSIGNIASIKDAMIMNIVMGKNALQSAKGIAAQIDALISPPSSDGTTSSLGGIFDHLQFYSNLTEKNRKSVRDLKNNQAKLKMLQDLSLEYQQQLAGIQVKKPLNSKDTNYDKRYNNVAEKAVMTQQEIVRLQNEVTRDTELLKNTFTATAYDLDGTITSNPQDIITTLAEIDKIDTYKTALRENGKGYEADSLEYLTQQFKVYSDTHREMMSTHRAMLDTGFFRSEKGTKLIDRLIGKKYQMSPEFKKQIEDNNEIIDRSLQLTGTRGYDRVQQVIQESIEENEQLSDREKYRLEAIIRIQLNLKAIDEKVKDITDIEVNYNSEKEENRDPLIGDTVRLKQQMDFKAENLNNLDILTKTIQEVVEQLDYIRNQVPVDTTELKAQLADLQKRKTQLETPTERSINDIVQNEKFAFDNEEVTALTINRVEEEVDNIEALKLDGTTITIEKADLSKIKVTPTEIDTNGIEDIDKEIEDVETKIQKAKKEYKFIGSPEYKRLTELLQKQEFGTMSDDEVGELDTLENDVNQWLLISGTIVNGVRLSDLIRQKIVLEQAPIAPVEEITEVTADELIDSVDLKSKTSGTYYDLGQTFDAVTAVKTGDFVEVSGISSSDLVGAVGFPIDFETQDKIDKRGESKQNNLLLTQTEVDQINRESSIAILPTNAELNGNYSVVIKFTPDINGEQVGNPLVSSFNSEYTQAQSPDAIYDLQDGDVLTLEIDPNDDYNKELFDKMRSPVGTVPGTMTQEAIADLKFDIVTELTEKDEKLTEMQERATELRTELSTSQMTIDVKAKKGKELLKIDNKIAERLKSIDEKAQEQVSKRTNTASKPTGSTDEAREELKRAMVIRVKDQENNHVALLKAKRSGDQKSPDEWAFEDFRNSLVNNDQLMQQLLNVNAPVKLDFLSTITVKKVLLGHPNFNVVKQGDGSVSFRYKRVSEQDAKKIIDIGYLEAGKMNTRSNSLGIDTTFIDKAKKSSEKAPTKKIPFIVIEKSGRKVAFPVRLIPQVKQGTEEFQSVFNSDLTDSDKANRLNVLLAERGIDIKEAGNAFIGFGNTNLTQEFFDQKIAEVEAIDNYTPLKQWLTSDQTQMEKILTEQVMTNINLSNPLHSPKVQLNLSEVYKTVVQEDVAVKPNATKKTDNKTASVGLQMLNKDVSVTEKPEDEIKKDC